MIKGLCHIYVDKDAAPSKIIDIVINAKCQRPGVCNAMETLLIHEQIAPYILHGLEDAFSEQGTIIKACPETLKLIKAIPATNEDYDTEYLEIF